MTVNLAQLGQAIGLAASLVWLSASGCTREDNPAAKLAPWYPATNAQGDPVWAVFEGRMPGTDPAHPGCDKVKVALVLYCRQETSAPTTYQLARIYVAEHPEGSRLVVSGSWSKATGTRLDPEATVYELDERAPAEFRRYWLLSEQVLFLLDQQQMPRVGTAAWSYVLNRTLPQSQAEENKP